jgi:hypothetical protein
MRIIVVFWSRNFAGFLSLDLQVSFISIMGGLTLFFLDLFQTG